MAEFASRAALNGYYKIRYGKLQNVIPDNFKVSQDIKFAEGDKIGDKFAEPIELTEEQGWAYALGSSGNDPMTLATAVSLETKGAEIDATQMALRSRTGYQAVARSQKSKAAFGRIWDRKVTSMLRSGRRRVEIETIHGQNADGIGSVASVASTTVTFTTATWASGIWAGMENAKVQFFLGDTHRNAAADHFVITAIDLDARSITLDAAPTDVVAGDECWLGEELAGNVYTGQHDTSGTRQSLGIHAMTATTSGNIFNVSSNFSLWIPSQHAVGGAMTFAKVNKAVTKLVSKGCYGEICLYVNPSTWADLLADEAAQRRHLGGESGAGKSFRVGNEGIEYFSQTGTIKIKSHTFVPEGVAYMLKPGKCRRIGSTDLTFSLLGKTDEFFVDVADQTAYELRLYGEQAFYTPAPGHTLQFTGIVNT